MGNTNAREGGGQHQQAGGGGVAGQRGGAAAHYGVPPPGGHGGHPQAQQMRDQGRLGHAPSTESMSQSPSESPGSAARSPLMFTPQVRAIRHWSWSGVYWIRGGENSHLVCRSPAVVMVLWGRVPLGLGVRLGVDYWLGVVVVGGF